MHASTRAVQQGILASRVRAQHGEAPFPAVAGRRAAEAAVDILLALETLGKIVQGKNRGEAPDDRCPSPVFFPRCSRTAHTAGGGIGGTARLKRYRTLISAKKAVHTWLSPKIGLCDGAASLRVTCTKGTLCLT
jgi:hypothetical protein